jgi:hypothetical protein
MRTTKLSILLLPATKNRASFLSPGLFLAMAGIASSQPTITSQPQDQTNYIGETATFSIVAMGAGSLSYQWQKFSTGFVDLASGTNATLTLPNVQTNNAGDYRCLVTDTTGTTNSASAHLYVSPPETLVISNSAPGMVTLSWKGSMVLLEAFTANSSATNPGDLNCALWFRVSDTSPVILPAWPNPRFFRLISLQTIAELQAAFQENLSICRAISLTNSVSGCEDCIRAYFLQPGPLTVSADIEEAEFIGTADLGDPCFFANAGPAIALVRGGGLEP